jgi:hypothetical protein
MARKSGPKAKKGPRKKPAPRKVSTAVLSDVLGLTDQRLAQLAAEGMPKSARGTFPLRDSVRWYVEYLRGLQEKAATSGPTRADIARDLDLLKLKKAQGEVFDRREVQDTLRGTAMRLGNTLELLATKIGRELNLTGDDVKMVRDLTDEARTNFVRDCGEFIEVVEDDSPGRTSSGLKS